MKVDFELGPRASYSKELIDAVAAYFGLGDVRAYKDLGGTSNLNALLRSSTGDYVVRIYRPWVQLDRLTFLQTLKQKLPSVNLPIPETLGWVAGDRLGLKTDRLIEVERFIPSEPVSLRWINHREAYSMLGRLHCEPKEQAKTLTFVPPTVHNYGQPAELSGWLEQTRLHIAHQESSSNRDTALGICAQSEEIFLAMNTWWERTGQDLPQQLVHGDYGAENILWQQDEIVALLDFDLADIHERVFELAYTTYWLFTRCEAGRSPGYWAWHKLPELLKAYQVTNGSALSTDELNSIPIEMARVPLYWIATAGFADDPIDAILTQADHLAHAKWLLAHPAEVLEHCHLLRA